MSRFGRIGWTGLFAVALIACILLAVPGGMSQARAETLESALMQAYQNNPTLNSQRASVRATDEGVPQALSGYRPRVSITASGGEQSISSTQKVVTSTTPLNSPATYFTQSGMNAPYGAGITATQTIFNGFQTANKTRQAESLVSVARETLRINEQVV
ncbi:MAG TPA: TolC family protein, partial [Pseudolabrys sp.]|nr:TolC family protein [Pseudolabrys sp.]